MGMNESEVVLRDFAPEDAAGVVACIREEYGAEYFRPLYYDADYLMRECAHGRTHFLIAACAGTVAGILELAPHGRYLSISTGIVRKAYRGRGIMQEIFRMAVERAKGMRGVEALCCRGVAYHDITQRRLEELGFVPTALLLAEFRTEGTHSYEKDANQKHPHVLLIRNLMPSAPRTLYVPSAYGGEAERIYGALHVPMRLVQSRRPLQGRTEIRAEQDAGQCACSIFVERAGADIAARVRAIQGEYRDVLQTFNVFLNVGDASSVAACEELRALGYFFTGFFPLCYAEEYMVLHNPVRVPIHWMPFVLTPAAGALRDAICRTKC